MRGRNCSWWRNTVHLFLGDAAGQLDSASARLAPLLDPQCDRLRGVEIQPPHLSQTGSAIRRRRSLFLSRTERTCASSWSATGLTTK